MARDDLRAIIERGQKIPEHGSAITTLSKKPKSKKIDLQVDAKQRAAMNTNRTLRGSRK